MRALRLALAAGLLLGVLAACEPDTALTVTSTGDGADASPGDGTCAASGGGCTLRAAIQEANARLGADSIRFALPGSGVRTIQLTSMLPAIDDASGGTTIDGYTQPGSAANTSASTDNAKILVQIRGTGSAGIDALAVTSGGNVVRGLAFFNLRRSITIRGPEADGNRVVGTFVGTDAAASFAFSSVASMASGIVLEAGASGNRIGTPAAADRNVISGNARSAIDLYSEGTDENVIQNNIVGLSPGGGRRLANQFGVDVNEGGARNVIGGTGPGERNVISGNRGGGVELSHRAETTGNQVVGNFFGTDLTGRQVTSFSTNATFDVQLQDRATGNLVASNVIGGGKTGGIEIRDPGTTANVIRDNWIGVSPQGDRIANGGTKPGGWGIYVYSGAAGNTIGPGNRIAYNPNSGIAVNTDASDGNTITGNLIWGNVDLGINLGPLDRVNPNDSGDGDAGPNQQLNFPVLTAATRSAVTGTACARCRVEVFEADGDSSGYGQGRRYLGATTAGATGSFSFSFPSPSVAVGGRVTATATDELGNTSEFAKNRSVTS